MTYEESWPRTISERTLIRELARHSLTLDEYLADNVRADVYRSADVLVWLGY